MPTSEVFLNIPYDPQFEKLYLAYIVGVSAFGMVPRATLEIPGGADRLDRILDLMVDCPYSLHDLSRVQLDRRAPSTPRFNMPFELGLAVACEKFQGRRRIWFVFEAVERRLQKSLSDLSATDAYVHGGTVGGFFHQLGNCFARQRRQPCVRQMWRIYADVRRSLPEILERAGARSPYGARSFRDISVLATRSANIHVR